jgi:hypothetical protein
MSSPNSHTVDSVRQMLAERIADPAFSLSELERQLGGSPSRQALRKFADGEGGGSFWERVGRALRGEVDVPGLAEEADTALRLMREAQATMLRVAERLRQLPPDVDTQTALNSMNDPMPDAKPGAAKGRRTKGTAG